MYNIDIDTGGTMTDGLVSGEDTVIRWSSTITSNVLAQRTGPKLGLLVSAGHEADLYDHLDADAVDAVLTATGQQRTKRRAGPSGLTPHEIEVLSLIARGASTRQVAHAAAPLVSYWNTQAYRLFGPSYPADGTLITKQVVKSAFELEWTAQLKAGRPILLTAFLVRQRSRRADRRQHRRGTKLAARPGAGLRRGRCVAVVGVPMDAAPGRLIHAPGACH
jgi:hypothetical protein